MNILQLFLKKIVEFRTRLFFTVITFSLSLFLSFFFLTLGINGLKKMAFWFESYPSYNIIYAEKNDNVKNNVLENYDGVSKKAMVRTGEKRITRFNNNDIDFPITEYCSDMDIIIPGGIILAGKTDFSFDEVLLGKSVLRYLKIEFSDAIGKEVMVSDSETYTVVGVFDDTEDINMSCCIMLSEFPFDNGQYIIQTESIDQVSSVTSGLKKDGYKVVSYAKEIADTQQYIHIIAITVGIIFMFILAFASTILYFSLRESITEMYPFIAMIKAFGYKRKEYTMLILGQSFIISLFSYLLTIIFYCFGMMGIKTFLLKINIVNIYGFSIQELLTSRLIVVVVGSIVSFGAVLAVSLVSILKLENKQVYDILYEVEQ